MKGLTYFKLKSPYPGDITKNCSLDGTEIDNNFFELESRDVKTAYWQNDTLIIERMNGDIISVPGITEGCTKNLNIAYDKEQGTLYVTQDGYTQAITGFISSDVLTTINSDDTLTGMGTRKKPIGISPMFETGQFRPAIKIIDTTKGEKLPDPNRVDPRNRFVTIENVSDYGYLYDYNGVRKIACDLRDSSSEWRIPTKEDWDDMLNAVEPCLEDRNHDKVTCNRDLGRFAGKLLKSVDFWRLESINPCDSNNGCNCGNDCNTSNGCGTRYANNCDGYCGEYTENACSKPNPYPNRGIDKYGFAAVPAGYGDDGGRLDYFGERGWYWTATNQCATNAYTKRFEYNKSSVYQEVISTSNLLSLRLVKDYDGTNFSERETILGSDYSTVLMPSIKSGKTIWMSTNVAFSNRYYGPVVPNNGMNLTYTKKFFVNEWDGKRWLKNELRNGDSIVILKAPTGEDNVEYRVINGELSNVATSIYDEVIIAIRPQLDSLKGAIASETIRAKEAERVLDTKIDTETARAVHVENGIIDQLTQEIDRAKQAEEALSDRIDAISTGHTEDIAQLNQKIDDEIARAKEEEEFLDQKIENETARAEAAETKLDEDIKNETDRATLAEEVIQENLDNEVKRALAAEEANENAINAEAELARANEEHLHQMILDEANRASGVETSLREDLTNEIARSTNKDNQLDQKIENETARAEAAETKLDEDIKNETDRATLAEEVIQENLDNEVKRALAAEEANENAINAEAELARANEEHLHQMILDEANRASGVETSLREDLTNEIARSTNKDNQLDQKIEAETDRAEAAEDLINKRIDDIGTGHTEDITALTKKVDDEIARSIAEDTRLDQKIDDEIARSTEQDTLITGRLIAKTGSVMDAANGSLTLATEDAANSITISLDFNFGSI